MGPDRKPVSSIATRSSDIIEESCHESESSALPISHDCCWSWSLAWYSWPHSAYGSSTRRRVEPRSSILRLPPPNRSDNPIHQRNPGMTGEPPGSGYVGFSQKRCAKSAISAKRVFLLRSLVTNGTISQPANSVSANVPVVSGTLVLGRYWVVLSKLSKLLDQEDALSAPCLRCDCCSPQAPHRVALECFREA